MTTCAALGCFHNSELHRHIQFHSFPDREKDKDRFQRWVHELKRKNYTPSKSTKLCSAHFRDSDYEPLVNLNARLRRLKKDAVPSIFDDPDHLSPKKVPKREPRPRVQIIPNDKQEVQYITVFPPQSPAVETPASKTVGVQTTLSGIELRETIDCLRHDKHVLQRKVSRLNRRLQDAKETLQSLKNKNASLDSTEKEF